MEAVLVFPDTEAARRAVACRLARFQAEQAAKYVQALSCPTEQKLELLDTAARQVRAEMQRAK